MAQGDMTPEPKESVYSSVAMLCSLCLAVFLAELNGLSLMEGDNGNDFLKSCTQEKVYFIEGPEFGPTASHTYIVDKALYGVRSSRLHFHECLSSILWEYGLHSSKVDPDLWMRDAQDVCIYIIIYINDIIVVMKDV